MTKTCTGCGEVKEAAAFSRRSASSDGLQPICKPCTRTYKQAHRAANRERLVEEDRQRRLANLEQARERARRYRESHAEQVAEQKRRWAEANHQHVLDKARRYYENNREQRIANARAQYEADKESFKERAKRRSEARREEVRPRLDAIKRAQGCADCGTTEGELHFDHRPGTVKLFNLSHGYHYSEEKLLAEIAKCDVRCNSCHGKRHQQDKRKAQRKT